MGREAVGTQVSRKFVNIVCVQGHFCRVFPQVLRVPFYGKIRYFQLPKSLPKEWPEKMELTFGVCDTVFFFRPLLNLCVMR